MDDLGTVKLKGQVNIDFLPDSVVIENADFNSTNIRLSAEPKVLLSEKLEDSNESDDIKQYHKEKRFFLNQKSCLNGQCKLWGKYGYDGYSCKYLSKEEKTQDKTSYAFNEIPTIKLFAPVGEKINSIIFWFDETYGEYATVIKYKAEDKEVLIDNHRLFVMFNIENPANEVEIQFLEWSAPLRSAKLRRIHSSFKQKYDSNRIVSFEASAEDRPDPSKIEYGLSSQFGSIEFIDINNDFEILNEYEMLQDNQPITVSMVKEETVLSDGKSHINKTVIPLGTYLSQDWEIKPNDNTIKVNLTDIITRLQNIKLDKINVEELNSMCSQTSSTISMEQVIRKLLQIGGVNDVEFDSELKVTEKINVNIFLDKGSVADMLKKVLIACKARIYLKQILSADNTFSSKIFVYNNS